MFLPVSLPKSFSRVGWSTSALYHHTADPHLFSTAANVAQALIDLQLPDGQWAFSQNPDEPVSPENIDATVELALWAAVLRNLLANL